MNLQEQINATPFGETLTLPDGSEHVGNFVFPRSIHLKGKATLISPNADAAISVPLQAKGISFTDIMARSSHSLVYDIVRIGTWQNTVLDDCPTDITFDRCDIFGIEGQQVQRGIAGNGRNISVLNSKVREIHGKGLETQAFGAWNGPGPFRLIDSYFEASGENIMFGGSDASIENLVASDIEVRRCKLSKPLRWRGAYSVKNLFELKNARRVVVEGCIMENCWGDAQIGFGVLFTTRNQNGANPWAVVEDVEFINNELLNVAGGFQLIGKDHPNASAQGGRIRIANNIIRLAQKSAFGPNGRLLQLERTKDVTFENNDADPDHTIIVFAGAESQPGLIVRNNITTLGEYGVRHEGGASAKAALDQFASGYDFSGNIIIAGWNAATAYPGNNTVLVSRPDPVPESVGVDLTKLKAAQTGGTSVPLPGPSPTPGPAPSPSPTLPSAHGTKATCIVDGQLCVWTLADRKTFRDGQWTGDGLGLIYKYLSSTVYVLGTDEKWYEWTGAKWIFSSLTEPGVPAPEPGPIPVPTEPAGTRKVEWPITETEQETVLDTQWSEGFRLKTTNMTGDWAIFEKVSRS